MAVSKNGMGTRVCRNMGTKEYGNMRTLRDRNPSMFSKYGYPLTEKTHLVFNLPIASTHADKVSTIKMMSICQNNVVARVGFQDWLT